MRRHLNESDDAMFVIRPLGKGKVIRSDLDLDNASGEIVILWETGNCSRIKLRLSFIGGDVEDSQIDVTCINEIYAFKSKRNIYLPFFEFMSQDGDVLGTDVWDALEYLGYIK